MNIFLPSKKLMSILSFSKKFILIAAFFIGLAGYLLTALIFELNDNIAFSAKELDGVEYLKPVKKTIKDLDNARLLETVALLGIDNKQIELSSAKAELDKDIKALAELDAKYGAEMESTPIFKEVQSNITPVISANQKDLDTLKNNYSKAEDALLNLVGKIADKSNLTLDPDLDTFYLMDSVTTKLPSVFKSSSRLISQSLILTKAGSKKIDDAIDVAMFFGGIKDSLDAMTGGFDSAYGYNAELKKIIDSDKLTSIAESQKLLALIDAEIAKKDVISADSISFISLYKSTDEKLNGLYDKAMINLESLLNKRVDGYITKRIRYIAISAVVFLIVAYLFVGFYLSIMDAIRNITSKVNQIALNSDLTAEFDTDRKDEVVIIADSFNGFVKSLRSIISDIHGSAIQNSTVAEELRTTSFSIGSRVEQQSAIVSQTTTAAAGIKSIVQDAVQESTKAKEEIVKTSNALNHASAEILRVMEFIHSVAESEASLAGRIDKLTSDADVIKNVLTVISDIAE